MNLRKIYQVLQLWNIVGDKEEKEKIQTTVVGLIVLVANFQLTNTLSKFPKQNSYQKVICIRVVLHNFVWFPTSMKRLIVLLNRVTALKQASVQAYP